MEFICIDEYDKVLCSNNFICVTTNTTTEAPAITTTTTTTTVVLIPKIYYGISSNVRITESFITSEFLTDTSNVGTISGKLYIFSTGYSYKYWCIPDINDGDKVINQIINNSNNIILAYDSYYKYYQLNPEPNHIQSITYGKIDINFNTYRIYRTISKTSNLNQYVYSF